MLPRVLEQESMETVEEVRHYDAMDHSAVNAQFVDDFLTVHGPCRGGEILDVGTGTARIPIVLATADHQARVRAIDLSETMLAQAEVNIALAGMASRVRVYRGDAKALHEAFGRGVFEGVISNTIIHHIPNPLPVFEAIAAMVARGGTLFVRDLVRPTSLSELRRLSQIYTGGESPEARGLFEASLHAALTLDEVRSCVKSLGLSINHVTMTSDRHWTWTWQKARSGTA